MFKCCRSNSDCKINTTKELTSINTRISNQSQPIGTIQSVLHHSFGCEKGDGRRNFGWRHTNTTHRWSQKIKFTSLLVTVDHKGGPSAFAVKKVLGDHGSAFITFRSKESEIARRQVQWKRRQPKSKQQSSPSNPKQRYLTIFSFPNTKAKVETRGCKLPMPSQILGLHIG